MSHDEAQTSRYWLPSARMNNPADATTHGDSADATQGASCSSIADMPIRWPSPSLHHRLLSSTSSDLTDDPSSPDVTTPPGSPAPSGTDDTSPPTTPHYSAPMSGPSSDDDNGSNDGGADADGDASSAPRVEVIDLTGEPDVPSTELDSEVLPLLTTRHANDIPSPPGGHLVRMWPYVISGRRHEQQLRWAPTNLSQAHLRRLTVAVEERRRALRARLSPRRRHVVESSIQAALYVIYQDLLDGQHQPAVLLQLLGLQGDDELPPPPIVASSGANGQD